MRQSLRSSASTTTTTSSSGATRRDRLVRVVLLNRQTEVVTIESKGKLQDVFSTVCERLSLRETEYFGLAKLVDDEYHFLELDTRLSKLLPKQPKSLRANRQEDRPLLTLYFRVQYYVEHVILLKERITRQLYYQQLRDNLLNHSQLVSEDKCFLLAAYSIQADIGNYIPNKHEGIKYFDAREYFPAWVVDKLSHDYIYENMPVMHRDLRNMPKSEAAKLFIRELSQPPLCHNTHMYKLKKSKEEALGSAWLGVCPRGIEIYEDVNGFKSPLSTFLWPSIGKLHFEKKKFEIVPTGRRDGRKFRYYTGSDERSKYLLWLCQGSHIFQLQMAPRLAEQRHMEAEDRKDRKYKESYIHSSYAQQLEQGDGEALPSSLVMRTIAPRRSVTSTASSNTTSGIASERLHTSIDDSEADTQSHEIMINSPPTPGATASPQKSGLVTSNSLKGASPVPPQFSHPPLAASRSGSGHSSKSGRLVARDVVVAREIPVSQIPVSREILVARTPSAKQQHHNPLKPADAQIKRTTFTQVMTVSSNPVVSNMAPIVSGVATSTHAQVGNPSIVTSQMVEHYGMNMTPAAAQVLHTSSPPMRVSTAQQQIMTSQALARPVIQEQASQPLSHNPLYIEPLSTPLLTPAPHPPSRAPVTQYPLLSPTTLNNHLITTNHMPDHTYANLFPLSQTLYSEAPSGQNDHNTYHPVSTMHHMQQYTTGNHISTTSSPPLPQPIQFHQLHASSHPPFYMNNAPQNTSYQTSPPNSIYLTASNVHPQYGAPVSHHYVSSGSELSGYNSDYAPYSEYVTQAAPQMTELNPYNIAPPLHITSHHVPQGGATEQQPRSMRNTTTTAVVLQQQPGINMFKSPSMEILPTRPNRSRSQTAPPNRVQSPPQRAVSDAQNLVRSRRYALPTTRAGPTSCPRHGLMRSGLLREIEAKTPGKFPLIKALCNDTSLQNQCTCGTMGTEISTPMGTEISTTMGTTQIQGSGGIRSAVEDGIMKRLSYSPHHSEMVEILNEPGTVTRPMSWHSEGFNLEQSLQVYNGPPPMGHHNHHHNGGGSDGATSVYSVNHHQHHPFASSHASYNNHPHHNLHHQQHQHHQAANSYNPASIQNTRFLSLHKSMDSLDIGADYPTMVTHHNGHVPVHMTSGMSGAKSLDNLIQMQHHCGLGVAS